MCVCVCVCVRARACVPVWLHFETITDRPESVCNCQCNQDPIDFRGRSYGIGDCGTLEIMHDEKWGYVCDDDFGEPDAAVVCRQLCSTLSCASYYWDINVNTSTWTAKSLDESPQVYVQATPDQSGSGGNIWMDDVNCAGTELAIDRCPFNQVEGQYLNVWGSHNCGDYEYVGVHTHTHTHSRAHSRARTHTHTHSTYIHTCMHAYIRVYTQVCCKGAGSAVNIFPRSAGSEQHG